MVRPLLLPGQALGAGAVRVLEASEPPVRVAEAEPRQAPRVLRGDHRLLQMPQAVLLHGHVVVRDGHQAQQVGLVAAHIKAPFFHQEKDLAQTPHGLGPPS